MKKAVLALAAVLALVLTASALGDDFSQGKGAKAAPNWKLLGRGPGGHSTSTPAQAFADGIGLEFGTTPEDTRLFLTSHPGSGLLGDLTGKTLTATFTITGTATAFTYPGGGPPKNAACPTPASVRLYFEGNTNGSWTEDTAGWSKQWWSTPQAYTLTSLVGNTLTLTVPLDTANWANMGFELASDVPTYFAAAVAKVGAVGVSFGGGCFLPTGAVPIDGTASFVLKSYSVS
jgi:hypothetical protein